MKYKYRATDGLGNYVEGSLVGNSYEEIQSLLYERRLHPIEIKKDRDLSAKTFVRSKKYWALVAEQMGTLLESGLELKEVLSLLSQQWEKYPLGAELEGIRQDVLHGHSLSDAFGKIPKFPEVLRKSTYIGEQTANLGRNLLRTGNYLRQEELKKRQIYTILAYPLVLITVFLFVGAFMVTYVLPVFEDIYENAGVTLPTLTKIVLKIGRFLGNYGKFLIPSIFLFIFLLYYNYRKGGKLAKSILKFPVLGKYLQFRLTERLSGDLHLLLTSGMDVITSLESIKSSLPYYLKESLERVILRLKKGWPLTEALEEEGFYPQIFLSFIRSGEESSSLEEVLLSSKNYFQKERTLLQEKYIKGLEPFLILLMSFFVGITVIAIATPMFEMLELL